MTDRPFFIRGPGLRPWCFRKVAEVGGQWQEVWIGDAPGLRAVIHRLAPDEHLVQVHRIRFPDRRTSRKTNLGLACAVRLAMANGDFLIPAKRSLEFERLQASRISPWARLTAAVARARGIEKMSGSVVITRTNSHSGKNGAHVGA